MFESRQIIRELRGTALESVSGALADSVRAVLLDRRHGELDRWIDIITALPDITPSRTDFNNDSIMIGARNDASSEHRVLLESGLRQLHPWRKGPFSIFGIDIDSEWQSNLKWSRLQHQISSLQDRLVLDVGCGNGYYMLRMLGLGAGYVLGVDPTQLFAAQYQAFRKYCPGVPAIILPLRCEEIPWSHLCNQGVLFDTVFSMGILYHRKSPGSHIQELYSALRHGGELVLETLVTRDRGLEYLIPEERYAKMRNVWTIPTVPRLVADLQSAGFEAVRVVDVTVTTCDEQRKTEWMTFESLEDFLNPEDVTQTIEGYPAPVRAMIIAQKPA